jgi:hypothetical protein
MEPEESLTEINEEREPTRTKGFLPPPILPPCLQCGSRWCGYICRMTMKPRNEELTA